MTFLLGLFLGMILGAALMGAGYILGVHQAGAIFERARDRRKP
tara:strand:- start:45049 stop:45177 length:129 start_codon:yes stop_codon:yes gene_type:complete